MSYWSCRLLSQSLKEAFFAMTVDSANAFPEEESEFHETGLTEMPAVKIKVPRVAEVPIHLECKLNQVIELGPHRHPLVTSRLSHSN
jgi:flavin reductase (DIM6/NTAB) family NADH-FMN oxidoreductase RutF